MTAAYILIAVLMVATLMVLIAGVTLMMTGGKLNAKYSNKLMIARVTLQALVVAMIGLVMLAGH